MTRVNGRFLSLTDLSSAYHQNSQSSEIQKLTSIIIDGKRYTYARGFYGFFGIPNFSSWVITIQFDPLIDKKHAVTYIDDTLKQSQSKNEMFTVSNE